MSDPASLLATLAQSSAAIVAIVGGFLVSRLVALSSEREGLRRQLQRALDRRAQVKPSYDQAHAYRLRNSQGDFFGWVIEEVVKADLETLDRDALLADKIPRGSSADEMRPYLEQIIRDVAKARARVAEHVRSDDDTTLDLDDLRKRGLVVTDAETDLYQHVVDHMAEGLPSRSSPFGSFSSMVRASSLVNPASHATEMRRLDDSIREEQELHSQKVGLDAEIARLERELELIGRPAGVVSAIVILGIYAVLGIVAPVVVMGVDPTRLGSRVRWLLISLFALGLFAVLAYIFWYARTLNDPIRPAPDDGKKDR